MDDVGGYLEGSLAQLLAVLQGSDVRELEVQEGAMRLRIHRSGSLELGDSGASIDAELPALVDEEPRHVQVTSPLVGTFYRASTPDQPPLVGEGSQVQDDTIVGIIEALQVLTPVEAGCTGVVNAVLATDGQPIEYGQPLVDVTVDV